MNSVLKFKHCSCVFWRFQKSLAGSLYRVDCNTQLHLQIFESKKLFPLPLYCVREYAKRAHGKMPKSGKSKALKLTDEELTDVIDVEDYRYLLSKVTEKLKKEYVEHLSIHSASGNIENILVKIGEDEFPLNELAEISKKNPNIIAVNLSNFPEGLKPALKAIQETRSDLNPQQDGTMIYLTVPKLTREYRETLAKNAKSLFVKAKDEVRTIQNTFVKVAKSKTELSEDLVFSATNQIMQMAEQCNADLENLMKTKQKDVLGEK